MRLKISFISLITIISIVTYLWIKHLNYLQELRNYAEIIKLDYIDFQVNYPTKFLKDRKDFDFMYEWLKENGYRRDYSLEDLAFGVKHDSYKNRTYLYAYGKDGKDDSLLFTPFNSNNHITPSLKSVPIVNSNFKDFLTNFFRSYDILLLEISEPDLQCPANTESYRSNTPFNNMELFDGLNDLRNSTVKKKFKKELYDFCLNDLGTDFGNITQILLVSIYRDGEVEIRCPKNLESQFGSKIIKKLLYYLETHKIDYFDCAEFPIYLSPNSYKLVASELIKKRET